MADAERLAPLREALETKANRPEEIQSILNHLAPASVDAVCQFLEQSSSPSSRRLYARTLGQIGDPSVEVVVERFERSAGDARAGYTLALGALEGKVVVSTLLEALEDPDHTVRREAVRALATKDDARARDALLRIALDDAEPTTRITALLGLGQARRQLDYRDLLQRIQSRGYGSLPEEEKTLLFMALGATGDEAVVEMLHRILKPSWILVGNVARTGPAQPQPSPVSGRRARFRCSRSSAEVGRAALPRCVQPHSGPSGRTTREHSGWAGGTPSARARPRAHRQLDVAAPGRAFCTRTPTPRCCPTANGSARRRVRSSSRMTTPSLPFGMIPSS